MALAFEAMMVYELWNRLSLYLLFLDGYQVKAITYKNKRRFHVQALGVIFSHSMVVF